MTAGPIGSMAVPIVLLFGCATTAVNYDYDNEYDFSTLKTYEWMAMPQNARVEEFLMKRVKSALSRELSAKGITQAPDDPDFLIALHGSREGKVQITDWGYSYGPFGRHIGGPRIDVHQYEQGTLIVDFVEAKTKQMVWRGTASRVLEPDLTPQEKEKLINEAVVEIMKNFPPGTKR
jgi:Domain of unknown function (DUF4136)